MQSETPAPAASKKMIWTGRVLSGLGAAFLLFDGAMKLVKPMPVIEATTRLGYSVGLITPLGIVLLTCVVLYLIPQTSIFGAILLTGYLGGAVATHTRVGDPLFSHILFPTYIASLLWLGLYFREERLRALVPFRK
jgi:hypothetical protein